MSGSVRIEGGPEKQDRGESPVVVKFCVDGRKDVYAYADTVAQAVVNLSRDPGLPLDVLEWLVPRGAVFDEPHGLRDEMDKLRQENHDLRVAAAEAKCERADWRRMVDMLLDRIEGRHR